VNERMHPSVPDLPHAHARLRKHQFTRTLIIPPLSSTPRLSYASCPHSKCIHTLPPDMVMFFYHPCWGQANLNLTPSKAGVPHPLAVLTTTHPHRQMGRNKSEAQLHTCTASSSRLSPLYPSVWFSV
jgi:hypothetical protein